MACSRVSLLPLCLGCPRYVALIQGGAQVRHGTLIVRALVRRQGRADGRTQCSSSAQETRSTFQDLGRASRSTGHAPSKPLQGVRYALLGTEVPAKDQALFEQPRGPRVVALCAGHETQVVERIGDGRIFPQLPRQRQAPLKKDRCPRIVTLQIGSRTPGP